MKKDFSRHFKTKYLYLHVFVFVISFFLVFCAEPSEPNNAAKITLPSAGISLFVLGNVQDGGSPHIGCKKDCCKLLFQNNSSHRRVVCLSVCDATEKKTYLFEATPDISRQMKELHRALPFEHDFLPDGIFLTHAHIGHYSGLMYLGKEALNAKEAVVFAMPRMKSFLEENGPWSQLVKNKNIKLNPIQANQPISLGNTLRVEAITVPHRDEFSETVGFKIIGPNKAVLFIPDIDKWDKWNLNIEDEIKKADYALLDGTFYNEKEINNRDIREIPHPFVIESMQRFKNLSNSQKQKIYFIHFNHSNPLLNKTSAESQEVQRKGFNIARQEMEFEL